MKHRTSMLLLLVTLIVTPTAWTAVYNSAGLHAVFKAQNGDVIELNTRTGTLRTPRSDDTVLHDCSDKFQTCLTDHHGFAFAYFRKCNDAEMENYKRLRFPPKVVSVLHNNLWIVFDAAPNYMFHYVIPKGIVGIYVGPTPSYDFRSIFHDRNFRLDKLDAKEYRITGSGAVAACSE